MTPVALLDYRDENIIHLFNPETGVLLLHEADALTGLLTSGYATRKRIGIFRPRIITVAVFCEGQQVVLWIEQSKVDLSSNGVCGKVRLVAPFIREFRLTREEQVLYSCFYWHSGARVWPDDGDIYSSVERITKSAESVARTYRIWTATREGRKIVP